MLVRQIMIAFCLIFIIQDITKSLEFLQTNKRYSELSRERSYRSHRQLRCIYAYVIFQIFQIFALFVVYYIPI